MSEQAEALRRVSKYAADLDSAHLALKVQLNIQHGMSPQQAMLHAETEMACARASYQISVRALRENAD